MSKFLTCTIMLGVLAASPAAAKPQTRAEKIAEAKASIEQLSDEKAIELWNSKRASMDQLQLTMDFNRSFARWLTTGFSIGMCEDYAKPALIADWIGKIDTYTRALGGEFSQTKRDVEEQGMRLRKSGQANSIDDELPPASAKNFCDIELEAVRQILLTL